jgi:hypothetical protein
VDSKNEYKNDNKTAEPKADDNPIPNAENVNQSI